MKVKYCLKCSNGDHTGCLIHNCQCPVDACELSRQPGNYAYPVIRQNMLPKVLEQKLLKEKEVSD